MVSCSVPSCSNNTNRNKKEHVTFHSFPLNNATLLAQWLAWLGKAPTWEPTQWSKVCSEHFTWDSFTDTKSVRRLKNDAVPSILKKTGIAAYELDGAAMALLGLKHSRPSTTYELEGPPSKMLRTFLGESSEDSILIKPHPEFNSTGDMVASDFVQILSNSDKKVPLGATEVLERTSEDPMTPVLDKKPLSSESPQLATTRTLVKVDMDKDFLREKSPKNEGYQKLPGYCSMAHGFTYHFRLVVLLLLRAQRGELPFKLATEYMPGGKFDDIYFMFQERNGRRVRIFICVSHSRLETDVSKIVLSDLIGDKRGRSGKLNLKDFLQSHINFPPNEKDRTLCILYTNRELCFGNTMKNMTLDDDMFDRTFLEYPNIFANLLLKFKNPELKKYLQESTEVRGEYIDKFLDEFALAVKQPSIEELKELIFKEIAVLFKSNEIETEMLYSRIFVWVQEWMERNVGSFIDNENCAKFLSSIKPSIETKIKGKINTIPREPVPEFCNRIEELSKVNNILEKSKSKKCLDLVVTGLAGVGKTEFVLKCVEDKKSDFEHILWINAENEESMKMSFHDLAIVLNIVENKPYSEKNSYTVILQRVFEAFSNYKCLFIFDNASSEPEVKKYLPSQCYESLFFVVTSQSSEWSSSHVIVLEVFSAADSVLFLEQQKLGIPQEDELKDLAEMVGHHPLALQLVAAYIKNSQETSTYLGKTYSIKDLLSEAKTNSTDTLEYEFSKLTCSDYNTSVMKVWDKSIEHVEQEIYGKLAVKMLYMLSYLEPDNISIAMFEYLPEKIKQFDVLQAFLLLKKYSLIKLEKGNVSIHKLLQEVGRKKCETKPVIIEKLLTMFLNCFKFSENICKFTSHTFRNHILKVWSYACEYESLIKKYCELPVLILGYYQINEEFPQNLAPTLEKILGMNHPQYLAFQHKTAELLYERGNYDKALAICDSASKVIQFNTIDIWLLKSKIFIKNKRFVDAKTIYLKSYKETKDILGVEHPKSLKIHRKLKKLEKTFAQV